MSIMLEPSSNINLGLAVICVAPMQFRSILELNSL